MDDYKYQKVAETIKSIFEKEFGGLLKEDFFKVAKYLKFTHSDSRTGFDNFYKNLSDDEKKQVDFMMNL